jgi:ribosomal protein S18 acetylase RimI-like enzyme
MMAAEHPALAVTFQICFRAARADDLPKLEWYGAYAHFRELFARSFREQQLGRRLMLIADSGGFPVGHIFLQYTSGALMDTEAGQRSYLYSLRVMDMFQRRGIGTRLIHEAESVLRVKGTRWATIAVAKDNIQAIRLYERLGYWIFSDDPGIWSYRDHEGTTRTVYEPCWLLQKEINLR